MRRTLSHRAIGRTSVRVGAFFQAEDGIRDVERSRGLGDVYKRQPQRECASTLTRSCLLYTSDAADDMQCVDLGGRRIIKKEVPPARSVP